MTTGPTAAIDEQTQMRPYRMMVEARGLEQRACDLFMQGLVKWEGLRCALEEMTEPRIFIFSDVRR